MKLARTLFAAVTLMAFCALSVPSFAQEKDQPDRDRMKASQTTITGCLTKADTGDTWVLVDSQTGTKMMVAGDADFSKHANHTVKLTGTPSEDGKTFTASNIEMISDTCQAK